MPPQRKIFISYRQKDNPDFADRIRDRFIVDYGRTNVFMDIDSLPRGADFADRIRLAMEQSDAVIAVIGPQWVELFRNKAANFEDDFVKMELELALKLHKPITPICVYDTPVPARETLPPKLRRLLKLNFAFLNRKNFHEEMDRIIADIEQTLITSAAPQAQAYFESANNKLYTKDYDGAIADYTAAIQLNPNFAEAYKRRGAVRNAKGEADTSIADYSEAIRLKPQDAEAYYNRGLVRTAKGDLTGAVGDFNEAIHFNPQDSNAYIGRGLARKEGDNESAIADYSEAIRLEPQSAIAYINRGIERKAKGDLKAALADFQKFLDLGGDKRRNNQAAVEQIIRDLQKQLNSKP